MNVDITAISLDRHVKVFKFSKLHRTHFEAATNILYFKKSKFIFESVSMKSRATETMNSDTITNTSTDIIACIYHINSNRDIAQHM